VGGLYFFYFELAGARRARTAIIWFWPEHLPGLSGLACTGWPSMENQLNSGILIGFHGDSVIGIGIYALKLAFRNKIGQRKTHSIRICQISLQMTKNILGFDLQRKADCSRWQQLTADHPNYSILGLL
jgi:hypothetical protein